jgi:hypothetical protein
MTALDAVIFLLRPRCEISHPISGSFFDQLNLPLPGPMFDVLLPLDGVHEQRIFFVENQSAQPVPARKTLDRAFAMLKSTPANIRGDACIEHAARTIRHDVTNAGCHATLKSKKMTASSAVMMREVFFLLTL